jgi:50S ribosomal protein L16 3-hydroxylase
MQLLGDLTAQQFLQEYWQKKPLLIRQAIPGFNSPITAEELAGFACEEDVESRLIFEHAGETPWALMTGPFDEAQFTSLPDSHWTLLVQKANQLLPELAEFLQSFDFIPGWRIDDIMISYAPEQGSVGPHLDQYDVFLLQGMGQRRWQINTDDFSQAELISGTPLKILKNFTSKQEWILEPGDMLYLPPNVAHYGVALNDCMTYSIGFRAPSVAELLTSFVDDYVTSLSDDQRYTDKELRIQEHPGEITDITLNKVKDILLKSFEQPEQIKRWFGKLVTESILSSEAIYPDTVLSVAEFSKLLNSHGVFYRSEFSRFAYIETEPSILLFIDGDEISVSRDLLLLVQQLCDNRVIQLDSIQQLLDIPQALDLLTDLYNRSSIWLDMVEDETI